MKPLIVLIGVFVLCLGITALIGSAEINLSGRIAMSAMLSFTAMGHFKFPGGMAMMIPPLFPARKQIVLITGVIEVLAAVGLFVAPTIKITGIILIILFLLILPANIYAAAKKVNLEKSDHSGNGINYLWFRIPEQVFFMVWVYYFAIK
ncbi:MAG: DoxX family protein [Parafilimonas sp.]